MTPAAASSCRTVCGEGKRPVEREGVRNDAVGHSRVTEQRLVDRLVVDGKPGGEPPSLVRAMAISGPIDQVIQSERDIEYN
jgi:hypothetical protein